MGMLEQICIPINYNSCVNVSVQKKGTDLRRCPTHSRKWSEIKYEDDKNRTESNRVSLCPQSSKTANKFSNPQLNALCNNLSIRASQFLT